MEGSQLLTKKAAAAEILRCGRLAWERRLVAGAGGNISVRLGSGRILITRHQASLGFLEPRDVVEVSGAGNVPGKSVPSSELPLHRAIYKELPVRAVLHAHPGTVLAFSGTGIGFSPISLEEKYYLGDVPVIDQGKSPTVQALDEVVAFLKRSRIVMLANHGTVAVGRSLMEAFHMTDLLEAALSAQLLRSLFRGKADPERRARRTASAVQKGWALFSDQHLKALVDRVNGSKEVQSAGQKSRFRTSLGFQVEDGGESHCWTFHVNDGRITKWEENFGAAYVFSAPKETWELVFKGELDPFVATLQGIITLAKGRLTDLSKWYDACQKVFEVWQQMKGSVNA